MANLKLGVTIGGSVAIHASNYNNYAPTLTGGNASGTWGINITGNSATTSQTNFSSLTINGAAVATQAYVTGLGYLTSYENNYVSAVALNGSTLRFTGEGSGFTGDIDLSTLGYLTSYAETDTLATVTARGSTTTGAINVQGTLEFDTYLFGDGKYVINVGDSWLRLNQNGDFGSGVYTPYILRNDGLLINYGGGRLYAGLIVEGNTKLGSGSFQVSTDQSFSTTGNYSFRDAVSIWNPNSLSAPDTVTVMSIGSMSNGVSLVATGQINASGGNSSNWNAAYNDRITAVSVSGGPTKTITLTQQDGGTLTASWSDTDTDTNTYLSSASFNTSNGVLTLTRSDSVTVTVDLDGRFYTQGESDGRYVNVTGDVMTGALGVSTSTAGIDSFYVDGTYGRLFTVTDDLTDAVFSVNTISGLPIIEAYSDYSVKMGRYGQNDFYINPSGNTGFGTASPAYKVDVTGSLRVSANIYVGGYIEPDGQSMNLRKVNSISFAPNNTWNDPYYHGIMSTGLDAGNADSVSINSYNDIVLRIDSNNNDTASYVRFMNNTRDNNQFAYFGYDGSNYVSGFEGVVYAGNSFRAPIFYDSNDSNYYIDPNSSSVLYSVNANRVQVTNDLTTSSGQGRFGGWYIGTGYTGAAVEVGFSGSRGYVISYSRDAGAYQPLELNGNNIYILPSSGNIYVGNQIVRQAAGQGWLSGNYASSETVATTGAIYSIGGSYYPTNTALNTMYGVGYTHVDQGQMPSGASSWGFYVAANGVARIWLGGESGNIIATGNIYAETNRIVATQAWVAAQGYLTSDSDSQTLSWDGPNKNLTISSGNTVTLDGLLTDSDLSGYGFITGYTETDTLAAVTGRGNIAAGDIYVPASAKFRARYDSTNNYHASLDWYGLQLGNNGDNYIVGGRTNPGGNLRFYVNNTTDFTNINGTLSAIMHSTGRTTFGGGTDYGYTLNVAGSFYATDWIRVGGSQGLYFESYGGGFRMTDSTWVRIYNDKNLYTAGTIQAARFEDANDSNYYVDPASTSNIWRLQANDKYHYFGTSSNWDNGSLNGENSIITNVHFQGHPDFWIGAGNTKWYTGVVSGHHDLLINTMQSGGANTRGITFTATSSGASAYRLGRWFAHSNQAGSYLQVDGGVKIGATSDYYSAPTAKLYVAGNTAGADVFAVDGVNGRLFTVSDDLSDSLFSVNTVAGLPIIEAFADNTVTIGKYGSNSITISNSSLAINSDTVDANFPFYVSDRSTAGGAARYTLANPGMGFNLADNYAQLQLYGSSGAYLDFVNTATDSSGRIMWSNSGYFLINGDMYFNNTLYTYTLYDRNDGAYYLDMNGTSRLGTVNANELRSYGNTYLGDGNGDETHINDILRIGATDSGDAHLYFGEGSSAGSDYGLHWYWDSGYRFHWYTRNAGSDTVLFYYDTNATTYVVWNRNHNINNLSLDYVAQIYFNAGTRFAGNDTHYLNFRTEATDYGSIHVRDGNNTLRGYLGYYDASGFGLLNSSGTWGVRLNPGNVGTELYYAGGIKLATLSEGTRIYGNLHLDDNYGYGIVGVYSAERYQGVFAMGNSYKLAADGTSPGTLYGIAWTHTNVGGESKSGLGHQALFMMNGRTYTAIGSGIWTDGTITTTSHGTSANWNAAYDWGNHAGLYAAISHNHDDRYYTESESDSRFVNVSGDTMTGRLTLTFNDTNDPYCQLELRGSTTHSGVYINPVDGAQAHVRFAANGELKWQIRAPFQDGADTDLKIYSWVSNQDAFTFSHQGVLTVADRLVELSSLRYKENIQSISSTLTDIEKLRPVTYNKIGSQNEEIGLIAEEVAEIYPQVIKYDEAGRPDGINYTRLSAILIKAVQELTEKIKKLEE